MEAIEKIKKLIEGYKSLPNGYTNISGLNDGQRLLATYCFEFAEYVGVLKIKAAATEAKRRHRFEEVRRSEVLSGKSENAARAIAEGEAINERELESIAEAEYQAARILLESARDVFEAMRSHISMLKQERSAEQWGFGSQQT